MLNGTLYSGTESTTKCPVKQSSLPMQRNSVTECIYGIHDWEEQCRVKGVCLLIDSIYNLLKNSSYTHSYCSWM